MILNESNATPMDLRFRLFGTYVRVHPLFWVFSAVLGWGATQSHVLSDSGLAELGVWVGCAFFSILLHEFGHVWMGRIFGSDGHIVLQAMGGLAIGASNLHGSGQRILVFAAGPAIQLVLSGILLVSSWMGAFANAPAGVHLALDFLLWINLFWASSTSCRSSRSTAGRSPANSRASCRRRGGLSSPCGSRSPCRWAWP